MAAAYAASPNTSLRTFSLMASFFAFFFAFFNAFFSRFFCFFFSLSAATSRLIWAIFIGFCVTFFRASCSCMRIIKSGSALSLFQVSFLDPTASASRAPGAADTFSSSFSSFGGSYFFSPRRYASWSSDVIGPPLYMNSRRSTLSM